MGYRINGINIKTDDLFQKLPDSKESNLDYKKMNKIYEAINLYTMFRDSSDISTSVKEKIKNIKQVRKENHYKDNDYDFMFCLLSDFFIDEELKEELTSEKRLHQCHDASIGLSLESPFKNVFIITGYVSDGEKDILHSVIEIDGEDTVIMDYTQNLMMKKEDFINITGFRELSKVSKEDLKNEIGIMTDIEMKVPYYLFFRNEIAKDLKKNNKVLKLHD